MEKHNPIFSLKNFRSFGEEGADFELAPITVLTGCNSAGKSSMTKALMLLSRLPMERNVVSPSLELYSKDLGLGQFDKVLNLAAQKREIVISFEIWSDYLHEYVIVRRFFNAKKHDALGDGYMCRYSVEKKDGTIIYEEGVSRHGMEQGKKNNSEVIRSNFDDFSAVAKYVRLKFYIKHLEEIDEEIGEGLDNEEKEFLAQKYNEFDDIKSIIEKCKICIDSYKYNHLNSWSAWCERREAEMEKEKSYNIMDDRELEQRHPQSEVIEHFLELVIEEIYCPWFLKSIEYVESASASIRRVYSIEEENKMNKALRVLNSRSVVDGEWGDVDDPSYRKPGWFINKWIKKFELGDGIEISSDEEGGIKAYLKKGDMKRLLADEGYGVTQLVSLLLTIENAIKLETNSEIPLKEGCPEYKQMLFSRPNHLICVEEPEVHLHPKFQSILADMFVEAYQKYNIHFIIETHSEYLIRKLQVMVADKENALTSSDVSLNYVEKDKSGTSHNRQIRIKEDGRLDGSFGNGFYDEAGGLSRQLFMLNE